MATTNRILLKKSSVVGKIPSSSDVEFGELALNFSDGRLYFKNSDNNIDFFEAGGSTSNLPFAANEGDFGSVSNTENEYTFELGSLDNDDTEYFTHDLGRARLATLDQDFTFLASNADLGLASDTTTFFEYNLGSVVGRFIEKYDLGFIYIDNIMFPNLFVLPSFQVSDLSGGFTGEMRLIIDEVSGTVPAFFDGANWKRMSDNQIVSTA